MDDFSDASQLKRIFDALSDFISYVDARERYVFVNRVYEAWFGLPADKIIGKPLREILGEKGYERSRPNFDKAMNGEDVFFETTLTSHSGGETKTFDVHYIPDKDKNGNVRGVIILAHDVTARKRTEADLEERMRERTKEIRASQAFLDSVIENIPDMIFVKDAKDLRFVRFNKAGEDLIGVPRSSMMDKNDYDFFPKDQADFFVEKDRSVLALGNLLDIPEEPIQTAEKGVRFLHTKKIPIVGADGRPEYLLGISEDITEAKLFEEQRIRTQETERLYREAQSINQIKDEFLATLSHELRTPLNVICGHSDILLNELEQLSKEEVGESIEAIHRNARMQTQIIDDLLDVSSIITGKVKFQPEVLSAKDVVQGLVDGAEQSAADKNVRLRVDIERSSKPLYADATRLSQILWNLISNAIKFTPSGGTVTVRAFVEKDKHVFQVEDTGIGIDPQFLPYVFDRFRQEDSSSTRRFGGLGLGLSIVRHLTELHDGTVKAESAGKGLGSRFTVEFPVAADVAPTLAKFPHASDPAAARLGAAAPLKDKKVLLVEDSKDSRIFVEMILRKAGAEVMSADSAESARVHLRRCVPDIIVSDIGMPEEDGCAFMEKIRQDKTTAAIPSIALTAYVRDEEIERAIQAGFQSHLAKPVSYAKLVDEISRLLEAAKQPVK